MFATVGIVLLSLLGVALLWTALSLVLDAVRARRFDEKVQGRHVLVTGGSKGLGLCVALEFARRGANVTVVARSEKELGEAKALLEAASTATGKVQALRCDVTDEAASLRTIEEAERALGPVFVLCTCAGSALTGYFLGAPADRFRRSFDLNYFGTLNFVRPVATRMAAAGAGHIVVVSSALALTAYQGYSAYTPTKWALRALCDTLRSELEPYGVAVHSAYPPGMDTPGYAVEQLTKTAECQEIERGQKLHKPAPVAAALVSSLARGRYHLACGDFDNALLVSMAAGMSPRTWPLLDIVTAPFIIIISFFVSAGWASTVNNAKFASVRPNPRELLDAARRRPSSVDEAKAE